MNLIPGSSEPSSQCLIESQNWSKPMHWSPVLQAYWLSEHTKDSREKEKYIRKYIKRRYIKRKYIKKIYKENV